MLYESIYARSSSDFHAYLRALQYKSPEFLKNTVKTVMVYDSEVGSMLALCSGATKLAIECQLSYDAFAAYSDLHPQRLSINVDGIDNLTCRPLLELPFFDNITHLEVYDSFVNNRDLAFGNLPCLTHLAFNEYGSHWDAQALHALENTIASCHHLQMLLILENEDIEFALRSVKSPHLFFGGGQEMDDDWDDHLRGDDIWEKARRSLALRVSSCTTAPCR